MSDQDKGNGASVSAPVAATAGTGSASVSPLQHLKNFKEGYTMTGGDWGALTQLFFDNLSTLLGALFAIQDMKNFGAPVETINDVVWSRIVPGVGLTMVVGNAYYTWQAIRLTKQWGRPYTAQPYGLNTPAAFAFVFNIMYPVYFSNVGAVGPKDAFMLAYKVALAANFITGLISTVLAFFGPFILKVVPPAALLVPIAGIGVAFLGLEQVTNSLAAPWVGYNTILWVFIGWYAGVRVGYKDFRLPEALQVIIVGVVLGWATGLNEKQDVEDAAELVKWYGPDWSADDMFADFAEVGDYMGIVIPIGISATATTLMCLVSAKSAGDPYPVRETMIADGIGTMIASFFGSPFGTVVYIGHPAYKKSGALTGYSLTNGFVYLALSWFGILALMQSIVNQATIGPIVLFVGLAVNEEALNCIPPRHYAAYIIGLFPSIYDWVVNIAGLSPIQGDTGGNIKLPGLNNWFGVLAWKRGALLVSFVWVAILVMVIDRKWTMASVWALIGAGFALFGINHVPEAGFENFTDPVWEQCTSFDDCWDHAKQYAFFGSYLMLAATFALIELARKYSGDPTLLPPHEDENDDMGFSDWFAEAAIDTRETHWKDSVHGGHDHDGTEGHDVSKKTVDISGKAEESAKDSEEAEA
eukprot:scaffold19220_cov180-Amphora_coffeaeformis.AAC.3